MTNFIIRRIGGALVRGGFLTTKRSKCGFKSQQYPTLMSCFHISTRRRLHATVTDHTNKLVDRERVRLGVIGSGRIASCHIQNMLAIPEIELAWIVDDDATKIEQLKSSLFLDDVISYDSSHVDGLLDDESLHGVLVLSPTVTHTPYTCQALKKRKGVFVEKPAGESVADIKLCYDTAEKYNTPLVTGYQRRFDPTISRLHVAYSNGDIGDPVFIKLTSRDCPKPSYDFLETCDTTGCNIISDMAIHDIDTLVWLTKAETPESIFVQTHAHDQVMREKRVDDTVMMMLKYKSGLIASIDVVRDSVYGYDVRVEIFGNGGMLTCEPQREVSLRHDMAGNSQTSPLLYTFTQRFGQAYINELLHFVRCIQGKETPLITTRESLLTATIVNKGVESWKTKSVAYFD